MTAHTKRAVVILCVIVGVVLIAALPFLPYPSWCRENASAAKCKSSLRQIGLGLQMYSQEYEGFLPESLGPLYPHYISSRMVFMCPKSGNTWTTELRGWGGFSSLLDEGKGDYRYVPLAGDMREASDQLEIAIAFDKGLHHDGKARNFLFLDGHVERRNEPVEVLRGMLKLEGVNDAQKARWRSLIPGIEEEEKAYEAAQATKATKQIIAALCAVALLFLVGVYVLARARRSAREA